VFDRKVWIIGLACSVVVVGSLVAWFVFRSDSTPAPSMQTAVAQTATVSSDHSSRVPPLPPPPSPAPATIPGPSPSTPGREANSGSELAKTTNDDARRTDVITGSELPADSSDNTARNDGANLTLAPAAPGTPGSNAPPPKVDAKRPEPANPAAVGNPFGQLPAEVDLDFETSVAEESRCVLGTLSTPARTSWSLKLDSGAADLNGFVFSLGEPMASSDDTRWPIQLNAPDVSDEKKSELLATAIDTSAPLAHVVANGETLSIAVPPDRRTPQVAQLRNCVLFLSDGVHTHQMQLRRAQRLNALTLDLTEPSTSVDIDLENPPADDSMVLQLAFAGNMPAGLVADPPSAEVGLNKDVVLGLTDWPGAKIEVRVTRSAGQYRIKITPTYEVGGKDQPLTIENITKTINRLEKQLAENKRDLDLALHRQSQLPGELATIQNTRPANNAEAAMLARAAGLVGQEARNVQAQIRRLSESIPKMDQAIARLKTLGPVVDKYHGKLQIPIRVFAKTTGGVIELLVTT
jgi:hypothetical protein